MAQITLTLDLEQDKLAQILALLSGVCPSNTPVEISTKKPATKQPKKVETETTTASDSALWTTQNIKPETPKVDLTELRAAATALAKKDKAALQSLFTTFDVPKLTALKPEQYESFMAELVKANG